MIVVNFKFLKKSLENVVYRIRAVFGVFVFMRCPKGYVHPPSVTEPESQITNPG